MSVSKPTESTPLENRKAIFLTLVQVQDRGVAVVKARGEVARQFGVTEDEVKAIEREGLDNEWPPL